MFIATPRAESQAPLGAACRPTTPSREPSMPLLTELVNQLLGQPGYRHGAPTGAVPPTQECEKYRLEPSPFQLPRDRSSRRKRFRSAKPRTPQLKPAPAHPQQFSFRQVGRARHSVRAGPGAPANERRARSDAPHPATHPCNENCWPIPFAALPGPSQLAQTAGPFYANCLSLARLRRVAGLHGLRSDATCS